MKKMIPCKSYAERLGSLADGQGSRPDPDLTAHLETCRACRDYVTFIETVRLGVKDGPASRLPKNPYLYSQISDKLERRQRAGSNRTTLGWAAAATVLVTAGLIWFAGGTKAPVPEPVAVHPVPANRFLPGEPTHAGLWEFWSTGKAPVLGSATEQIGFFISEQGEPSMVLYSSPAIPAITSSKMEDRLSRAGLDAAGLSQVDSVTAVLARALLIDQDGRLLLDPDVFRMRELMEEWVVSRLGAKKTAELKSDLAAMFSRPDDRATATMVITLPEFTDRVQVSRELPVYALVPVDELTVRGVRLIFPGLPVLTATGPETGKAMDYRVVQTQSRMWHPTVPDQVIQVKEPADIMTLAEANQYLFAIRAGVPVDSLLAVKASKDAGFRKFLATHPELRKYRLDDERQQDRFHFRVVNFGKP
ncbi:MAG: hypothetical protein HUU10_06370 [Bacteroidetes bacterium]|nr:hypothetical protein [Bacteroidota bacterium]